MRLVTTDSLGLRCKDTSRFRLHKKDKKIKIYMESKARQFSHKWRLNSWVQIYRLLEL